MKSYLFFAAFLFLAPTLTMAQKYGHLNFGNLISSLEETKAADSELEAFQKQLVTKGEEMAANWQKEAQAFAQQVQGGNLTPKTQSEQQAKLEQERNEILAYEQEVSQKVQAKRQELLEPLITRAETAIQEVAKENGYTMIFDTSVFNAILFAKDSDDVLELVKAKL
ncbi:MAG: OmpH family outer membrane protein [Phaeodactylibacter sp.]|uniref:OmpH family outer membrane protein n=1 Tax=Phaeodactylibacter sp. TaxID=1940289 RepID=UPI0032F032C7